MFLRKSVQGCILSAIIPTTFICLLFHPTCNEPSNWMRQKHLVRVVEALVKWPPLQCAQYKMELIYYLVSMARGKVISSVHLSVFCQHKNHQIEDSGILMISKRDHIVGSGKKLSFFCFLTVDTRHEHYKLCNYVSHAYWPHLAHHVLIQLRMLKLNIGIA